MSNILNNTTSLQEVLEVLQTKAAGENLDEEISTQSTLITEQDAKLAELAEILSNKAAATPTLQNKTVTPTSATQNIIADSGYDGLSRVTVNGDENLVAENIKSGVSIFGVEGNAETGGSSDGDNTVSITISGAMTRGFDADGNSLSVMNGTYDFLNGIVAVYMTPHTEIGTYVKSGENLYKFSVDGGRIICEAGGGGY
jgi:hypothetical protein